MIERIVAPPLGANAYLILDEKKALVDVGGDFGFIHRAISKYIDVKDLDYIVLTHTHFDHASATKDLREVSGAEVLVHEKEYEFAKLQNFSSFTFGINFPPFEADRLLNEGDEIDLGRLKLKIIHTPGHTPGSICLYEKDERIMFTGDTVFPNGGFGRVDLPGGNPPLMIESLKRLTEFDIEIMYPGHDEPVNSANEHVKISLKFARMFL